MGTTVSQEPRTFQNFDEFYMFYLGEHQNRTCRRLHFVGTSIGVLCIAMAILTLNGWWLLGGLAAGYAFAWIGHFAFEKNKPATFKHPFYSFAGDWVMYKDVWMGRLPF